MFAVPGWSVSADKLKSEITNSAANGDPSAPKPKKRKRPGRTNENVTAANVADLWERVIEHKDVPKKSAEKKPKDEKEKQEKREKKRQKTESTQDTIPKKDSVKSPKQVNSASKSEHKSEKKQKREKKDKKKKHHDESKSKEQPDAQATSPQAQQLVPAPKPAPKLTPLQASMREKLVSARFRHLNETLYTRPSAEAYQLFQDSPEMFQEYHEGFRRQVGVWPENPVDGYIADIRQRGRARYPPKDQHRRHHAPHQAARGGAQPLPRTDGTCVIADLGCGDARLASELQADKRKLRLEVLSYDLHSPAEFVTKADIANLPLADGAVDLAIFCLALMGTNWVDFVEEAYRVLRWKGELWIAEIKSRFGAVGGGKKGGGGPGKVVEHSVGNRKKAAAAGKKGKSKDGDDPEANETELAVEVDGVEDKRQQTDVSAFLEALRKRGFILQGEAEEAVDLSNKMFVKMRFVKALSPVKGKGVAAAKAREAAFDGQRKMKKKFIEDEADGEVNEAKILKPCVYKIR
ncbi:putative ribosomal rna-processing protein 8 protein [Phaeoacremonium minimum UCRPA7]|uniref:Ribosomal RNA-processing protein 8 n=1 Tax=Phaeoacremonium minimum (strain UCR-PA7) TaxID=1286976 RepID=R8BBG2_PHAM7|nr:putative ribosomal rna-processing protein 8 protein [Phaeoacremonium minimum UCRPA7]EON96627.1 putative ribosomal rna-processing protein 8 protein [Phaeoacremonium minimum UCRPA7]